MMTGAPGGLARMIGPTGSLRLVTLGFAGTSAAVVTGSSTGTASCLIRKPGQAPPDANLAQALARFGLVDFQIGGAFRLDLPAQPVGGGDLHFRMHLQFTPPEDEFVALGIIGLEPGFILQPLLVLDLGKAPLFLLQPFELVDALLHDGDAERGGEFGIVLRTRQHARGPGIGDAHRRQTLAELERQPDVDVEMARRQFAQGFHSNLGLPRPDG